MRRGDIRFNGQAAVVEHASARGRITRNSGNFTRGSQLLSSQYKMAWAASLVPLWIWLGSFIVLFNIMVWLGLAEHEFQLDLMKLYSAVWTWVGGDRFHLINLTLPDGSVNKVPIGYVPYEPHVVHAWNQTVKIFLITLVMATAVAAPLISWFITWANKRGRDVLTERHNRGSMLVARDLLGREDHRVARVELDWMGVFRDAAQRGARLALPPCRDDQHLMPRQRHRRVGVDRIGEVLEIAGAARDRQNAIQRASGDAYAATGLLGDLGGRQEQKSVSVEERSGVRPPHPNELISLWQQLTLKSRGRRSGEFRRRSLDNGQNGVISTWKGFLERNFTLTPVQIGRNQGGDIGIDGEILVGIEACRRRESHAYQEHQPCMARAKTNNGDNDPCQHRFSFYFLRSARDWGCCPRRQGELTDASNGALKSHDSGINSAFVRNC